MAKKFTEELTKLTTPDIRSVLRFLNNNVEKLVKPTELASMKHDKCLKIIEDKYEAKDIEKALDALASGSGKTPKPPKTEPVTKSPKTKPQTTDRTFTAVMADLHGIGDKLDSIVKELNKTDLNEKGASYILDLTAVISDAPCYVVIGASANGAIVIDGPHPNLETAHKAWPEAILPAPIANAADVADLL